MRAAHTQGGMTALLQACEKGHAAVADALIAAGANLEAEVGGPARSERGSLSAAAAPSHPQLTTRLLPHAPPH